ncbi:MAG: hypothetical protein RBU30_16510 [Polyangia bacterium]|jgi:hypothetical protein|nr:hypothetical protein [Polyangia bacterium]
MRNLSKISAAALLFFAWGATSSAQPAPIPGAPASLEIGIFAPNSGFTGGTAFSYITGLARHLQTVTGIPTTGKVWRSADAFRSAAGTMHFAVLDPIYLCRNRGYAVLATGQLGGGARAPWGLYAAAGINNLGDLKGKRLALAASGAGDASFAEGMLGGRLKLEGFVGSFVMRSDLASAINAVKGGAADAVLAPVALATGLRLVFSVPSVPNAGFVVVKRGLPQALISRVSSAVTGYGAAGVGGWGGAAAYSCPSGRVQFPMAVLPLRFVPPAQSGMIRKLQPGKGYQPAPLLSQFQMR